MSDKRWRIQHPAAQLRRAHPNCCARWPQRNQRTSCMLSLTRRLAGRKSNHLTWICWSRNSTIKSTLLRASSQIRRWKAKIRPRRNHWRKRKALSSRDISRILRSCRVINNRTSSHQRFAMKNLIFYKKRSNCSVVRCCNRKKMPRSYTNTCMIVTSWSKSRRRRVSRRLRFSQVSASALRWHLMAQSNKVRRSMISSIALRRNWHRSRPKFDHLAPNFIYLLLNF